MAISNAISDVFPGVHHGLCLWHIYNNVLTNLNHMFRKCNYEFNRRFRECIHEGEMIEEFLDTWTDFLKDFNLEDNKWLQGLYKLREKWAQVYAHIHFCAGVTTTQRSESINKFLKAFFRSKMILREFVNQYAKAMTACHESEREEDFRTRQTAPSLWSNWSVEREASKVYTRKIFYIFQEEYKKTLDLRMELVEVDGDVCKYKVEEIGSRRSRTLTYNQSEKSVFCTCRKFGFQGILCSHALKLFRDLNFLTLPSKYYLKRWTKNVVDEVVFDSYGEVVPRDIDRDSATRYSELSHIWQRIIAKGATPSDLCSVPKSELLQIEVKLDALAIKDVNQGKGSQKDTPDTHGVSLPDTNEDAKI